MNPKLPCRWLEGSGVQHHRLTLSGHAAGGHTVGFKERARGRGASKQTAAGAEDFSLEVAMALYDLEHIEVLWERRHDTMALLGWGPNKIVIVFRGTSTLRNVLADMQARSLSPPSALLRLSLTTRDHVLRHAFHREESHAGGHCEKHALG